jgi:DNA polymerase III delta subunit
MKFNEAIKEFQFRRSKRFILGGDEIYQKELFIDTAKNLYPELIFYFYPGDEATLKNAFYLNLFETEKLIIIRHFEEFKKTNIKDWVKKYTGALIIHVSEEVNLKSATISDVLTFCTPVSCNKMAEYGPDYPTWLATKATERGYLFVEDAETKLYQKVGPDMLTLYNELEKLMIYKESNKAISPEDVEQVTTQTAAGSTYDILDNILRKDTVKIFKSLELYLKHNELSELVYFLSHYFEKLYKMLLMQEEKMSPESIGEILGIHPFLIKTRYLSRARSFGKDLIVQCLDRLCKMDIGLRTFPCKRILIDRFIFSLIT